MNNSKSMPLSLQVYKTHAEFKAFRLNRTEKCRLESTRVFLSREERNFHKDFRTNRFKMETDLMRHRLSAAESVGNTGPTASSTPSLPGSSSATTPRTVSAVSQRWSSELPSSSYSSRRGSLWSWPDAMSGRGKALHRRRQTYGGHSALLSSGPVSLVSGDTASIGKSPSDCDFCGKVSGLLESRTTGKCAQQTNETSRTDAAESCQHRADTTVNNKGEKSNDSNRPAGSDNSERLHSQVPVDMPASRDNYEARGGNQRERQDTSASHSFRRYSKSASSGPSGITHGFQPSEAASLRDTVVQEEIKNGADPSVSPVKPSSKSGGKSDRKVSIMEPPSKAVHTFPKSSASQSSLNRKQFSDNKVNAFANIILEHAEQCTVSKTEIPARISSALGPCRGHSASIFDLRKRSEPFCSSNVIRRISQFLDQQADFNKLFPLKNHEIKFYKNPRPDLLKDSRAKEKQVSKQKALMISEVMENLGLTDNGMPTYSKTSFPKL